MFLPVVKIKTSPLRKQGDEGESMAAVDVPLPDLGKDAGDEARVSFWYVDVGETVGEGDDLVQMLTDKATFDVPSPVQGKLVEQLAGEEQAVKVGQALCRIQVGG